MDELALRKLYQIKDLANVLARRQGEADLSHQSAVTMSEVIHDLADDLINYGEGSGSPAIANMVEKQSQAH